MSNDRDWVGMDCLQFINNLFMSIEHDERVDFTLRRIFTETIGKLMFWTGTRYGMHVLCMADIDNESKGRILKVSRLFVGPQTQAYLTDALVIRHHTLTEESKVFENLPTYLRYESDQNKDTHTLHSELSTMTTELSPPWPTIMDGSKWKGLLLKMNQSSGCILDSHADGDYASVCKAREMMALPLSSCTPQYLTGNLGIILLWNDDENITIDMSDRRTGQLKCVTHTLSSSISRFMRMHHGYREEMYLPDYRMPAPARHVTVMFADIRGFTPATEILRNFNLSNELKSFMLKYHERMGQIISEEGGRVHGLAGDGIMALFGEYAPDARSRVEPALRAARRMCAEFERLKKQFFDGKALKLFFEMEYEPLEIRLGVGINYGPVIFDYFGARGSRVYAPLGDHVNFAQRLESEANRYDSRLHRNRAPILLSRPAWKAVGADEKVNRLTLQFKGKPYEYQAFEYDIADTVKE